MMKKADDFLVADFQQQYEEYRQAENSRLRYIEFFVTILVAFLSFSAYLFQISGFPMSSRSLAFIVLSIFAIISFILFSVGLTLFRASLFTRVSQLQTALYIDKLRGYFGSRCEKPITNYAKLASFAYEEWYDTRIPAIQLLLLLAFLTSVPLGPLGYCSTRLLIILSFPDKTPGSEWPLGTVIYSEHVIAFILGLLAVIVLFFLLRRYLKNTLNTKRRESLDKLKNVTITAS